jgi:lauroyl/myristoyl acyltransferase
MALAGNAVTLPIYSHFDSAGILQVRVRRPQAAASLAGTDRRAYVRLQTERLAAYAEAEIRSHPAQWHHWRLLHEMARATFSAEPPRQSSAVDALLPSAFD